MAERSTDMGINIRRARVAAGLTQSAAADAAGLSRAAYRNLEAGTSEPRTRTLIALAKALEVRPEVLLAAPPPLPRARFRSLKRFNDRTGVLLSVSRQLEDYAELEDLLQERRTYKLSGLEDQLGQGPNRPIDAADVARRWLDLDADEPIRDIGGLLEDRAGIKVLRLESHTEAFFGLSVGTGDGGPAIVVNTWDRISVERWIFTAAHELGHLILHDDDYDPEAPDEITSSEQEANLFASHFLMPARAFRREWDDASGLGFHRRVLKIKRIFHVSYRTVLYRLQEEYRMPDVWRRFQVDALRQTGRTFGRTDEPHALGPDAFGLGDPEHSKAQEPLGLQGSDFEPDRRSRLVRRAVESDRISLARAGEILGVPLTQMKALQTSWV